MTETNTAGNHAQRNWYGCSAAENATRVRWQRSTITELRTTAKKPLKSVRNISDTSNRSVLYCWGTMSSQVPCLWDKLKLPKVYQKQVCLLLLPWFTLQRVSSANHNIMVSLLSITGERSYPSSVCANCCKEKGGKKDEGNSYHGVQWKRQAGPLDRENFWQREPRRKREENPTLWVVKILAFLQIHSLKSKNIKQSYPICHVS